MTRDKKLARFAWPCAWLLHVLYCAWLFRVRTYSKLKLDGQRWSVRKISIIMRDKKGEDMLFGIVWQVCLVRLCF